MNKHKQDHFIFWLFLAPALIAFLMTVVIPFVVGFYYSLTDWNAISSDYSSHGFANMRNVPGGSFKG